MHNDSGQQGKVLWFTGLSGAGKTTTARAVASELAASGVACELLDGDELRETICKGLGFSREDRIENIRRVVYLSKLLSRHGVTVLVSAITPYREMREHAREQLPGYVEIHVDCALAECERRDVKGLYAKARNRQIERFTGISDPYETPERPELTIRTDLAPLEHNTRRILEWLAANGVPQALAPRVAAGTGSGGAGA
ncbi:adenylyl-sulfate kinase [Paenibacillus cymbidii]|uniref:adenylyl-sulfate kinase n=1 Tax=Paenibacillus cymbidii TaxID=1639034 RepID=UPI001080ECFA|nr:adenylyl-sulfate kinase [Paenibacillus cymbidii]